MKTINFLQKIVQGYLFRKTHKANHQHSKISHEVVV